MDYILKYIALAERKNEPDAQVTINRTISKLAADVVKDKKAFEEIKTKTPELAKLMQTQIQSPHREKGMEREWD